MFTPLNNSSVFSLPPSIAACLFPPENGLPDAFTINVLECFCLENLLDPGSHMVEDSEFYWTEALHRRLQACTKGVDFQKVFPNGDGAKMMNCPTPLLKRYVEKPLKSIELNGLTSYFFPLHVLLAVLIYTPISHTGRSKLMTSTADTFIPILVGNTTKLINVSFVTSSSDCRWFVKMIDQSENYTIPAGKIILLCKTK